MIAPRGSVRSYAVFTRAWWKENPEWPNGLEPHPGPRLYLAYNMTEEEARAACKEYNDTHEPGRYSVKAEYEEE